MKGAPKTLVVCSALVFGCSDTTNAVAASDEPVDSTDAGTDAGTDGGTDAETDAGTDGGSSDAVEPEPERGLLTDQTIDVAGVTRSYLLFVPDDYENAPIVFLLHGYSTTNEEFLGLAGGPAPYRVWLDIARRENVLVVAPNGLVDEAADTKGWNDCRGDSAGSSSADDVGFMSALVDSLVETYAADSRRVYAQGTSNGGHMSIRLALEMPEKLAAFAVVVAANAANSECSSSEVPVPAMFMNGTADPLLPYDGGEMIGGRGEVLSNAATMSDWVRRNGANPTPESTALPDINTSDESQVEKDVYEAGASGAEVVAYHVLGGGHTEPSIDERVDGRFLGPQNADMEMANEVWAFFSTKTK